MTYPACVISSRCIGYQIEDGLIRASVWSGIVQLGNGETVVRYWLDTGGARRWLEDAPRIDRGMPERPSAGPAQ